VALPRQPYMSVEDYLNLDRNSQNTRYEYYDGELKMLAGGSTYHATIMWNLAGILHRLLHGGPCRAYGSDMRLQLTATRYVYPDITITCDQRDYSFNDTIHHPRVVIEVLSPSTEAKDRGKKFTLYRECSTIQEYVMIDSQSIQVEVYHRNDGKWTLSTYGLGDQIKLESLNIQLSSEEVYEGLDFNLTPPE
jgi:Uma2 family endonuclease